MRCKATRTSGSYSSGDWEKASNYTNDAALVSFINGTYTNAINDLTNQIDGKIESWFQTTDPAASWTTNAIKAKHVGDMWYNSTAKSLKRYSSSYAWVTIEDKTAIDAYNTASQAKDTADGKRRVFVATPYAPYDIGDLWVDGKDLRRCATAKVAGQAYNVLDWVTCVAYDNTKTVIDGGLVTSGTIQVAGDNTSILAGITGQGTAATSVRFWAGASFESRDAAPFRVLQNGKVIMTNAEVSGTVNATAGTFRNVTVYGSTRNAFSAPVDSFVTNYNDNVALVSTGGGWLDAYSLPWDVSQTGRKLTIVNYKWNGIVSQGAAAISAPTGKYFFENGISSNELKLSREAVELIGFGDASTFYGWIVLQRVNVMTSFAYGRQLNVLAMGVVTGTSNGASISYQTFDGKGMSVSRLGEGRYRVYIPSNWFYTASGSCIDKCIILMTGIGYSSGSSNAPIKPTLITRTTSYFDVDTSDDASRNDGSFMFQITNMNDWS